MLDKLDLSEQGLTELPLEVSKLTQLEVLILDKWDRGKAVVASNNLSALPLEIGQWVNLRSLDLCSNRLSTLSPEISQTFAPGTPAAEKRAEQQKASWTVQIVVDDPAKKPLGKKRLKRSFHLLSLG
ncbi:MAG TPA: hypothetical protein V6D06_08220 [Trichocoleus sp.]